MNQKERSFEMARRLKELRNSKKLSHDKLRDELQNKFGIKISRASLLNYEIDNEFHSKAGDFSNLKMNAEFLSCLADFYGVSTDYLLCRTDIKSRNPNMQEACKITALSEDAISALQDSFHASDALNYLLLERAFKNLLMNITFYKDAVIASALHYHAFKSELPEEDKQRILKSIHDDSLVSEGVIDALNAQLKTNYQDLGLISDEGIFYPEDFYELRVSRNLSALLRDISNNGWVIAKCIVEEQDEYL